MSVISDHLMTWAGTVESAFGAGFAVDPAALDCFLHEGADLGDLPTGRIVPISDKTGTRAFKAPVQGSFDPVGLKFSVNARGGETANTLPRIGPFFKAAGFVAAGGTLDRDLTPLVSMALWGATADGTVGHGFAGVVVPEFSISGGEDLAKWEFSATAARGSVIYKTTLAVAASTGTALTLNAGNGWVINGAPAYVKIVGSTKVFKITAFNPTTNVATVSVAITDSLAIGAIVTAYYPGPSTETMLPIAEQTHSVDLNNGAEEVTCTKWTLSVKTGMDLRPREGNSLYRAGVSPSRPTDGVRLVCDSVFDLPKTKISGYVAALADKDVVVLLGPAGGRQIKLRIPFAKVEKAPPVEAADGPRMGTFEIGGYTGTNGKDITIQFI